LNQVNEALLDFENAISLDPKDGLHYLNRGLVYGLIIYFYFLKIILIIYKKNYKARLE